MSKPTFFVTPGYGPVLHELLHYSQALRVGIAWKYRVKEGGTTIWKYLRH